MSVGGLNRLDYIAAGLLCLGAACLIIAHRL